MIRRFGRVSVKRSCVFTVAAFAFASATNFAQAQVNTYGAPLVLQPVGARVVGHGEAAVADSTLGTDALWWNPAGMARLRKRELAFHFSRTLFSDNLMVAFASPSTALGTIAVSGYFANFGDIPTTDGPDVETGLSTNHYYVLTAAYATPVGKRLSFGLSAKNIRQSFIICSGCVTNKIGNTSAIDLGAQYIVPTKFPLSLGASVRNLGPALQTSDAPQADPLPRVIQVGLQTRLPLAALEKNKTALEVMSDVFLTPAYTAPSIRVGAELTYRDLYSLRGGYKYLSALDGNEGGLTVGVGLKYNSLHVDLARRFDSSSGIGESGTPTYVSLRFVF